jgi:hypothetical protein
MLAQVPPPRLVGPAPFPVYRWPGRINEPNWLAVDWGTNETRARAFHDLYRADPYQPAPLAEAQARAGELLRESFPDSDGIRVTVRSSVDPLVTYLVDRDSIRVRANGHVMGSMCLTVGGNDHAVPLADRVLQRALLLECDEALVWRTANVMIGSNNDKMRILRLKIENSYRNRQ